MKLTMLYESALIFWTLHTLTQTECLATARWTGTFLSPHSYNIKFLSHTTCCTSVQNWEKLKMCHVFHHSELELGFQIVPVLSTRDTTSHKTMTYPREDIRFKKLTKTTTKPIYICAIRCTSVIITKEALCKMIL